MMAHQKDGKSLCAEGCWGAAESVLEPPTSKPLIKETANVLVVKHLLHEYGLLGGTGITWLLLKNEESHSHPKLLNWNC